MCGPSGNNCTGVVKLTESAEASSSVTELPAVWVQLYDTILPSASLLAAALKLVNVCSSTDLSMPALATGGRLTGSTVTSIVSVCVVPSLSVTVSSNVKTCEPSGSNCTGVVKVAMGDEALLISTVFPNSSI